MNDNEKRKLLLEKAKSVGTAINDLHKALRGKGFTKDEIKRLLKNTTTQQRKTKQHHNPYIPKAPHQGYLADIAFLDKFKQGSNEPRYLFVVIDEFSKYIKTVPLFTIGAQQTIAHLKDAFKELGGTPQKLITDNGREFSNEEVQKFLNDNNIEHKVMRTYNHYVERVILTLKKRLDDRINIAKETKETHRSWVDYMKVIVNRYNKDKIHSTTGEYPAQIKDGNINAIMRARDKFAKLKDKIKNRPIIKVGDKVRIFEKPEKNYMENKVYRKKWSEEVYKVIKIETLSISSDNVYHLQHKDKIVKRNRHEFIKAEGVDVGM